MEQYVAAYQGNTLDVQDFRMLGDNIPDLQLDVNQGYNANYSNLYRSIFGRTQRNNGNLRLFDSANMRRTIESKLISPYLEILFYRFGLHDGQSYTLLEISKMIGRPKLSKGQIMAYESKAIRLLKSNMCARELSNVYDNSLIEINSLTPDESSRRASLLDRIYGSNLIFIPDEEFAHEPDDITISDFREIASELCAINESCTRRKTLEEVSYEDLVDGSQGPTSELEKLRNRKKALEEKLADIRAQNKSAKKLSDRYESLLNNTEHNNTKDTDVKGE